MRREICSTSGNKHNMWTNKESSMGKNVQTEQAESSYH